LNLSTLFPNSEFRSHISQSVDFAVVSHSHWVCQRFPKHHLRHTSLLYVRKMTGKHLLGVFAGCIIFSARGMHYFFAPRYWIQSNIFSQLVIIRTRRNVLFISKLCRLFLGQQARICVHLFFSSSAWKMAIPSIYGILIRVSFRSFYHHSFYLLVSMWNTFASVLSSLQALSFL
jgi:hypothetical protein